MSGLNQGKVMFENKPGRIQEIEHLTRTIISQDPIRAPLLLSLRGKMLFAEGHLFGKLSAVVCNFIADILREGF